MNQRKSLLFLTTDLPWPPDSGGKIKTFRIIEFLSHHYDVRVVCAFGGERLKDLKALRENCGIQGLQAFQNHQPRTAINWLKSVMQFPTFNAMRVFSRPMEAMLAISVEAADLVIVDHLEMMEMIPEKLVPKVIYHSHNAEFKLWQDFAHIESNAIKKWAASVEADRVKNFERWAIKKAKFTFAAPNDSELLVKELGINPEKFKLTYHLGQDSLLTLPAIDIEQNPNRIFFAGTLSWQPNRDGLLWFIRACWPTVKSAVPDAALVVCGKGADAHLVNTLKHTNGVVYKGYVEDLNLEMANCRAAIVPLRFGSGMKIKTFDALYRGLPLVCTTTGAEGIAIETLTTVDQPDEFAKRLVHVLNHPEEAKAQAENARKEVSEKYTYKNIFNLMLHDLKQSE